jgi:hypothetical protein
MDSNQLGQVLQSLSDNASLLTKAMEAGVVGGAIGNQVQGGALQPEDLSTVLINLCATHEDLVLQKIAPVKGCQSTVALFNRQISHGDMGVSAVGEGVAGLSQTGTYIRTQTPICYYAQVRVVTDVQNAVKTFDGISGSEREAKSASIAIALDTEMDLFLGRSNFSNSGLFDGNPNAIPDMRNILGLDAQIRMNDQSYEATDQMFKEFGGGKTVVVNGASGTLTVDMISKAALSLRNNWVSPKTASKLYISPEAHFAYNQAQIAASSGPVQMRALVGGAGGAPSWSGADLRHVYTSSGFDIEFAETQVLRGKDKWANSRAEAPGTPSIGSAALTDYTSTKNGVLPAGVYRYVITAGNAGGEGRPFGVGGDTSGIHKVTVSGSNTGSVSMVITQSSGAAETYYNIYRTAAGASTAVANYKWVGRVKCAGATTTFIDLGGKGAGYTNAYLVDSESLEIHELRPYSRQKAAKVDLTEREIHYRWLTLAVTAPRKHAIIDNIAGLA